MSAEERPRIPLSRPLVGAEEKAAVMEVLESGLLVQGPRVAALEEHFARLVGVEHAIATSSGTAALLIGVLAHGIGAGDEVITTPFTFVASANSILLAGARPVFVDIEEDSFNLDPARVEAAVTPRTRAIMPVHLYGNPCDMEALAEIARRHGLLLIEDCAQAIGATCAGRPVGSFGTGCFSLYATKNVMAAEGGMITTRDGDVATRARLLRDHGAERRDRYTMPGYNLRLSDIHAAIAVVQIERLDQVAARRRANASYLASRLRSVAPPRTQEGREHVWHQFTVRVDQGRDDARDRARAKLAEAGVATGVYYPVPVHRQPHLRDVVGVQSLPVAERAAREVMSLPVHPALSEADLELIVEAVNRL